MNQAQEYLSYADYAAYQSARGLKPTISSHAYAQEVEHCKRADKRLARLSVTHQKRDPHSAAPTLASAIFEIQGESK
jgi:hypothetical protein